MLKRVHYGPHSFTPWCGGSGFVDTEARSLKSFRSREPESIWQSLNTKGDDLGEYDVHFCPHCLLYSSKMEDISRHLPFCRYRERAPGRKVFENDKFEVLEVCTKGAQARLKDEITTDGEEFDSIKLYLQCLSLFGHLFIDTKSICFTVDTFLFYVVVEKKSKLACGFFSKEIHSWHDYNLACIVVFPPWQSHGLGQLMIDLSYMLSRLDKKSGSPEKPLSKHGKMAYNRYWINAISRYCACERSRKQHTLKDLSKATGIDVADLSEILKQKHALNNHKLSVKKLKR